MHTRIKHIYIYKDALNLWEYSYRNGPMGHLIKRLSKSNQIMYVLCICQILTFCQTYGTMFISLHRK